MTPNLETRGVSKSGEAGWQCVSGFGGGSGGFFKLGVGGFGSVGLQVVLDFLRDGRRPELSALSADASRRAKLNATLHESPQCVLCVGWLKPKGVAGIDSAGKGVGAAAERAVVCRVHR